MTTLACVELGGSGSETVVFSNGTWRVIAGAHQPDDCGLAIAVPGIIEDGRVVAASNLGWYDVDPAAALGLPGPARVVLNDAEAAALGEAVRRSDSLGQLPDVVFVGLGTGVGGAVVRDGRVVATNLLGHATGFSDECCRCGQVGCLETIAAGWALPDHLSARQLESVARGVGKGIDDEPLTDTELVVVAGGMVNTYPGIVDALRRRLPDRVVDVSAAPAGVKSASAWGLRHTYDALVAEPDLGSRER